MESFMGSCMNARPDSEFAHLHLLQRKAKDTLLRMNAGGSRGPMIREALLPGLLGKLAIESSV